MKVFRPKTCGYIKATEDEEAISSFDRKWRFIRQNKVTPMDLAICWDMSPEDPQDEPKRSTHIDGSNGSAAPAVFSLVHTPKDKEEDTPKCDGIHGCGPLFLHGTDNSDDKRYFFHRVKHTPMGSQEESLKSNCGSIKKRAKSANSSETSVKPNHCDKRAKSAHPHKIKGSHNGSINPNEYDLRAIDANNHRCSDKQSINSKDSTSTLKNRAKSAQNLSDLRNVLSKRRECNNNDLFDNVHHSTPNLSDQDKCGHKKFSNNISKLPNNRLCVACELRNIPLTEKRPKSDYKTAFKAGLPQKNVSRCYNYVLNVPQQKIPYRFNNYIIDSLAPPFSLQKSKGEGYPEHWRLATVYQHSYKPIHARKRPLMQTVFK